MFPTYGKVLLGPFLMLMNQGVTTHVNPGSIALALSFIVPLHSPAQFNATGKASPDLEVGLKYLLAAGCS